MKCRLPFSMKTLTTVVLVALLVACVTIHTGRIKYVVVVNREVSKLLNNKIATVICQSSY